MITSGRGAIDHPKQGMLESHIRAFAAVARKRKELITVRPVSPWAKAMIADGCPTKGFAVKAKSSNWGPQCGLIPADPAHPYLSKVGMDKDGMEGNVKFIKYGLAHPEATTPLVVTRARIDELLEQIDPETGAPPLSSATARGGHDVGDLLLTATCPKSSGKAFTFLAKHQGGSGASARFAIFLRMAEPFVVSGIDFTEWFHPVYVFSGPTPDGGQKPLVADYDLLSVSPLWRDFDPKLDNPIIPVGIKNAFKTAKKLHEAELGLRAKGKTTAASSTDARAAGSEVGQYEESHDFGNWSVRVRNCVDALNAAMGYVGKDACLRTVHHSADLISPFPQDIKDDLPATIFVPTLVDDIDSSVWLIDDPENLLWFLETASKNWYIPRNSAHKGKDKGGLDNQWGPEGFRRIDDLERHLQRRVANKDVEARLTHASSQVKHATAKLEAMARQLAALTGGSKPEGE